MQCGLDGRNNIVVLFVNLEIIGSSDVKRLFAQFSSEYLLRIVTLTILASFIRFNSGTINVYRFFLPKHE